MVGRLVSLAISLGACGRISFSTVSDAPPGEDGPPLDAAPIAIKLGARPGATPLGTRDTFLSPVTPDVAHGLELGMQCDNPDVVLLDFALPDGGPYPVLAAAVHLGVTTDRLEAGLVELHEMLQPWSEESSTWNSQTTGTPWETPGAGGAYASAVFGSFDGRMLMTDYVVTVPVEIVERWWAGTSFGIAITVSATGVNLGPHEGVQFPELRPQLDLTYQP